MDTTAELATPFSAPDRATEEAELIVPVGEVSLTAMLPPEVPAVAAEEEEIATMAPVPPKPLPETPAADQPKTISQVRSFLHSRLFDSCLFCHVSSGDGVLLCVLIFPLILASIVQSPTLMESAMLIVLLTACVTMHAGGSHAGIDS